MHRTAPERTSRYSLFTAALSVPLIAASAALCAAQQASNAAPFEVAQAQQKKDLTPEQLEQLRKLRQRNQDGRPPGQANRPPAARTNPNAAIPRTAPSSRATAPKANPKPEPNAAQPGTFFGKPLPNAQQPPAVKKAAPTQYRAAPDERPRRAGPGAAQRQREPATTYDRAGPGAAQQPRTVTPNVTAPPSGRRAGSGFQIRQQRQDAARRDGAGNLDALKRNRKVQNSGGGSVIQESDNRRIIRSGGRSFITRDETRRINRFGRQTDSRRRPGGGNISTLTRPNGIKIISETSPDGRLIRRYRIGPNGRRQALIDNRRTWRKWGAIGAGAAVAAGLLIAIDPPRYRGPRESYIIDYDRASYDDIYDALDAPPIETLDRSYTLDEVLGTYNLRARMRQIDLDSITFETGSWDVDERQANKLEEIARAIRRIVDNRPDEIFLIEAHTDAVGDEDDNLSLSDRRAEEVANILTEDFDIPPENIVTQGYGEQFLKVETDGPSRENRRVTVRRITPLLERRLSRYDR